MIGNAFPILHVAALLQRYYSDIAACSVLWDPSYVPILLPVVNTI